MSDVRLFTRAEDLEGLRPYWDELLVASGHPTPFVSWEWLSTWWNYFGMGTLHIITVWDEGKMVGLAPLYQVHGPWGMRSLRMMGNGQSDYLDFLTRAGDGGAIYSELLKTACQSTDRVWILLEQVPPERLPAIREFSKAHRLYL